MLEENGAKGFNLKGAHIVISTHYVVNWIIWVTKCSSNLELCILMWLAKAILVVNYLRIPDAGPVHVYVGVGCTDCILPPSLRIY